MKNIIQKLLTDYRSFVKLAVFASADAVLICVSVYLSFVLRFEGKIPLQHLINIEGMILLALISFLPALYFFKLYFFSWSYVGPVELIALSKATALSFLFLITVIFLLRDNPLFLGFPRSTLFVSYFLIVLSLGGIRLSKRIYLQLSQKKSGVGKERVLIVGAGDAGEQMLRSILGSKNSPYFPVGFVDDGFAKQGVSIHGFKVLGKIFDIPRVVKEEGIESLIVALPSAGSRIIREAVEMGRKAGLKKIKIIPSIAEIINSNVNFQALREVQVEDLLGREPIALEQTAIENFIQNRKILITGAAGSIGSELSRQVSKFHPSQILLLDQDETGVFNISEELKGKFPKLKIISFIADIRDEAKINQIFNEFCPNVIFHAAAYKHVPLMEENPDEAVKNNIFGTKTVAEAALKNGAEEFIFISTDKAVNPKSVMGTTKRAGEMICQSLQGDVKFISVRFGNVLDSRGSVIPIFREQIKRGGPVEITHPDMQRYFMTTPEACLLVLQAGAMGQGGEVFVLDMGKPIKIIDLAKELIRLSGLESDRDIPIVFTEPRPGEKFFEDILTAEEGTVATKNQKIFTAKLSKFDQEQFNIQLTELEKSVKSGNKELILEGLQKLVLNYHK
ncbi:MAG: nucleoside-diphosphate sugar epimerase/dehydratase [bacterium]|nr:nucleoside-diphosphate sugar epimerase/dehydratase [bacterium]